MFLSVLYFLVFILILSYLFFSKYVEFCSSQIIFKNKNKEIKIKNNNTNNWNKKNNQDKTFVIEAEYEDITCRDYDQSKIKGYLK